MSETWTQTAIIGAGFGGLGAALRLGELGQQATLYEGLKYPGGCASTFSRAGYRFESGATLFSGFGPGQVFADWIQRHNMDVQLDWLDPMAEMRAPDFKLSISPDRDTFINNLCDLPGAPVQGLRAFFQEQGQVADALWALFDDPAMLPPFGLTQLAQHAIRVPAYLPLLRHIGRPLQAAVKRHGLQDWKPLRVYLNALCQITVQASAREAESPFAMSTMDYWFRGTAHVRGGIGALAHEIVKTIENQGTTVHMACPVRSLTRVPGGWRLETRRHTMHARRVIANLLPQNIKQLLTEPMDTQALDKLAAQVETGWGAVMLYRVVRPPPDALPKPMHLELIQDPDQPFTEGNHLFCSISGPEDKDRAPDGMRTMTISTHIALAPFLTSSKEQQAATTARIQEHMRHGIQTLAPEWCQHVHHELPGSPRTFARFTRRHGGYVGGIPRRAGLHHYTSMLPKAYLPDLYLVGDSVFPGQSTLATAVGGYKLAQHLS